MPKAVCTDISSLISGIVDLPTPPMVYTKINEAINNPNASAYKIGSMISEDPAMSAKILRLSNSAFYGSRNEITTVKQAVITIGIDAIKSMVLSTSVFDAFRCPDNLTEFQENFWRHSLAVASACRLLVRKVSSQWISDADKVFSAGLLHDIGKLVMITYLPDDWALREKALLDSNLPVFDVELATLGYSHAEIGAALSTKWNLPGILADSIKYHHRPMESEIKDSLASLVYCSDFLAHRVFDNPDDDELLDISPEDQAIFSKFKISTEVFQGLKTSLIDEYSKSAVFLELAKNP